MMLAEEKESNTLSSVLSERMKDVIGGKDQIELWVKTKRVKLSEGKPRRTMDDWRFNRQRLSRWM